MKQQLRLVQGTGFALALVLSSSSAFAGKPVSSSPVIAASAPSDCYSGAGCLDGLFGNAGKVLVSVGTGAAQAARAVAVQPDGKLVVGGMSRLANGDLAFTVLRFESNGTIDPLFGSGGQVVQPMSAAIDSEEINAISLLADGSILVAGKVSYSAAVLKLDANGVVDSSFGSGGQVTVNLGASNGAARALAVQSDGKIVLAAGSGPNFAIIRLNADGSLDSSFGSAGVAKVLWGNSRSPAATAMSLLIQPDGKIVAGGEATPSRTQDFALARLNANGSLDSSFGSGGRATLDFAGQIESIYSIALDASQRIVAVGRAMKNKNATSYDVASARFNANGSLDSSYGVAGKSYVDGVGGRDEAFQAAILADGRIVVAGTSYSADGSDSNFIVARLDANGALDASFGNAGVTLTDFGGRDYGFGMAIQADGLIDVVGIGASSNWALARYLN